MPGLPETRYSLLARLADPADADSWSEFVRMYEQAVYRYSRSRGLQEADAWDVVQKVLLLVHQKIGQWMPSGEPGAFRAWLLRTAHYVCQRAVRDALRVDAAVGGSGLSERLLELPSNAAEPTDRDWQAWAFCWAAEIVRHEVELVTWNAFSLCAIDGIAASDAADRLGVKVGSVYTAKCRVMARIRELVQELSKDEQ